MDNIDRPPESVRMPGPVTRRAVLGGLGVAAVAATIGTRMPTADAAPGGPERSVSPHVTKPPIIGHRLTSTLGATTYWDGLMSWVGDGTTTAQVVTYAGLSGWQTNPAADQMDYIYTSVYDDASFLQPGAVTVVVNYWDGAAGSFHLDYNSTSSTWSASPSVQLTGMLSWQSHAFELSDASFANTENGGASFRINTDGSANGVAVASIVVAKSGMMWHALTASRFLDSIGVNTHIGQGEDDPTQAASAMAYAGIHAFRDDGRSGVDWVTVAQTAGAKINVLSPSNSSTTAVTRAEPLATAGVLLSVEGPNEPNNFPVTYDGETSGYTTTFKPVAELQRDLYANVQADSSLSSYPVFHSSEAGGSEPDNQGLQFLTIPSGAGTLMPAGTTYADYANTHNYVSLHGGTELIDNEAWGAEAPAHSEGSWDGLYGEYGTTWHEGFQGYQVDQLRGVLKVTTETGIQTSGTPSVSEYQQGKLILNLLFTAARRGWSYTFIYMLHDSAAQGSWGLFNADWTPKLSATYLHNMTSLLADDVAFNPVNLQYAIPDATVTVHDLLLQKSDGSFWLAVWNDRHAGAPTQTVTVSLAASVSTAAVYDPTFGTSPIDTYHDVTTVSLDTIDRPLLVKIVP